MKIKLLVFSLLINSLCWHQTKELKLPTMSSKENLRLRMNSSKNKLLGKKSREIERDDKTTGNLAKRGEVKSRRAADEF